MGNETVMTFASLVVALLATTALFYGNFLAAYLIDLLTGRGVPPARFFGVLLVTGVSSGSLLALIRLRSR